MTKFIKSDFKESNEEKTVFTHFLNEEFYRVREANLPPKHYKKVKHLYTTQEGKDVFMAWNEGEEPIIYIGKKGNEF